MIRGVGKSRIVLQDDTLRDYFTDNALGLGIADLHKQAAYMYNNHIYIAYADVTNQLVYVMAYDTIRQKWSDRVNIGTLFAVDSHRVPSLLVDANGYIHVFFDCHGGGAGIDYQRSTNPEDISQWTQMNSPTDYATYPQAFEVPNGDIYLFYRGEAGVGGGHDADWSYRVSTDSGATWSAETAILDGWLVGIVEHGWYFTANQGFDEADIYCGFQYYDGSVPSRYNAYYMWYDYSASQWKNAAGANITGLLPLTLAQANANCLVRNSGANETTCARGRRIFLNEADQCHCVVYSEFNAGVFDYKYADWKAAAWNIYNVGVSGIDNGDNCCLAEEGVVFNLYIYAERGTTVEKWWSINLGVNWNKVRDIVLLNGKNPQIIRNTPLNVTAVNDYIILGTTYLFLYQHTIDDFIKNYMPEYPYTFEGYEHRDDLIQIFPTKVLDTDGILMMDAGNRKEIIKGWDLDFSLLVQYLETCHNSAFETWLNHLIDWVEKIKITPHEDRWMFTYHVLLLNSEWLRRSIHELKEDSDILLRLEKLEPYIN